MRLFPRDLAVERLKFKEGEIIWIAGLSGSKRRELGQLRPLHRPQLQLSEYQRQ